MTIAEIGPRCGVAFPLPKGQTLRVIDPEGVQVSDLLAFGAADGRLRVDPPVSRPGDYIRLRAEMDLIVGLTACSAYSSNGGSFKPIHYEIEAEAAVQR